MRTALFCLSIFCFLVSSACRPAAAPVSVSNRPVSINDVPQTNVPLPPRKPIGEMSWTTADGITTTLATFKGKAVILDFWATFCPPCRAEIPHLNALQAKYGSENLHIVGLNVGGDDDKPLIAAFLKETKMDYPIAFPEDDLTRFVFADRDDIPQTLVIDRNGRIVKKIVGFSPGIEAELDIAVEQAIMSEPPA